MKDKERPQFSVIIPVRNRKEKLERCLESVLEQTIDDLEVIVVDSSSTDGTVQTIREFARRDPRVRYLNEQKAGIGSARNRGERSARGKIILMTDSDCEVPRRWVERMSAPVIDGSVPAVQGFKHALKRNYWSTNVEKEEHRFLWSFFERNGSSTIDTANFCISKNILKDIGYTKSTLKNLNDTELAARIMDKGYSIALLNVSVGHHNPMSMWTTSRKLISRGAYHSMLRKSYPLNPVFNRQTIRSFLSYMLGLVMEVTGRKSTFLYDLVSGMSWRFGLVCGAVRKTR
ncbi:MAG: glycosyltransferase family 2 protein [Candidatus Thermoplasmatota archaeon]|nr:glycosyltransferase family 2 protein [Candidatus Thermoplasmatota archaeon]